MKIYTKTGDKGMTKLVDGRSVEKSDLRVEAYGCVDELNSALGVAFSQLNILNLKQNIEIIQNQLFSVGSLLATADISVFEKLPQIQDKHTAQLEKWIDESSSELPALKNFILPSGDIAACQLHVARTICRRAERRASEIYKTEAHYQNTLIYLNRLSDLLFTWARWVNLKNQMPETIWNKDYV